MNSKEGTLIQIFFGDKSSWFRDELLKTLCGSDSLGVPRDTSVLAFTELPKSCGGPYGFVVVVSTKSKKTDAITYVLNKTCCLLRVTERMIIFFTPPNKVVIREAQLPTIRIVSP